MEGVPIGLLVVAGDTTNLGLQPSHTPPHLILQIETAVVALSPAADSLFGVLPSDGSLVCLWFVWFGLVSLIL